jgi:hypothetical protein
LHFTQRHGALSGAVKGAADGGHTWCGAGGAQFHPAIWQEGDAEFVAGLQAEMFKDGLAQGDLAFGGDG